MNPRPRYLLTIAALLFLILPTTVLAGGKTAGAPSLTLSEVHTRATEDVSVLICPAGDGRPLSEAMTFGGGVMDATVEMIMRDSGGHPIAGFPSEDIWLEGPGLQFAIAGSTADIHTQTYGYTEWALPLGGGGSMESAQMYGTINSNPVFGENPLPFIRFNSPDMNGDLVINLVDVSLFAQVYLGGYSYSADFYWDGLLNMVDVAILAQHYGHDNP